VLIDDFKASWDATATDSPEHRVGRNFMFAGHAFGYVELVAGGLHERREMREAHDRP